MLTPEQIRRAQFACEITGRPVPPDDYFDELPEFMEPIILQDVEHVEELLGQEVVAGFENLLRQVSEES